MTQLIKSDFRKFFKDKMFLVVCILAVGFAVITPLLYQLLLGGMGEVDPMVEDMVAGCTVSCHCGPGTLGIIFVRK